MVKQGGIVAVRESASLTRYSESEGITVWREVGGRMARAKGGNPRPGRFIHIWAMEAGFCCEVIKTSASSWCFSNPDERKYWGGSMEEEAVASGIASKQDMEKIAMIWRAFVEEEDAWYRLLREALCWK